MDELDKKVYDVFSGRVVKKGATKLVKGASNVPTYVLEYLLGTYCTSDDDKEIEDGIAQVKKIIMFAMMKLNLLNQELETSVHIT